MPRKGIFEALADAQLDRQRKQRKGKEKKKSSGQGGHGDLEFRDGLVSKPTTPGERSAVASLDPDIARVTPRYASDQEGQNVFGPPPAGGKPRLYMEDQTYGLNNPAMLDVKAGHRTVNPGEVMRTADRPLPMRAAKVGSMTVADIVLRSSERGLRIVAGSQLPRGAALSMASPEKVLKDWAALNPDVDSRAFYAMHDGALRISQLMKEKQVGYVASSQFSVIGRDDTNTLIGKTTLIDLAHPTTDAKIVNDNVAAGYEKLAATALKVAKDLHSEEYKSGTQASSPMLTNLEYDASFQPSYPLLRGSDALQSHQAGRAESIGSLEEDFDRRSSGNSSPVNDLSDRMDRGMQLSTEDGMQLGGQPMRSMVPAGMAQYSQQGLNMTPPGSFSTTGNPAENWRQGYTPAPRQMPQQPSAYSYASPTQWTTNSLAERDAQTPAYTMSPNAALKKQGGPSMGGGGR